MAKSNLLLLQEAIQAGDLEKAKELTAKLAKAAKGSGNTLKKVHTPGKAPRKPAKASVKAEPTEAPSKAKRPSKAKPAAPKSKGRYDDESSYIASSKRQGTDDLLGQRNFVGADGKQHTYARRVSMAGTKFVNKFSPTGYTELTPKEKKLEKQLKSIPATPRPGQPGAARDKAEKITVRCSICNKLVSVWPWEAERVPGDDTFNFRCSERQCTTQR